jgi:hypothetical protein
MEEFQVDSLSFLINGLTWKDSEFNILEKMKNFGEITFENDSSNIYFLL